MLREDSFLLALDLYKWLTHANYSLPILLSVTTLWLSDTFQQETRENANYAPLLHSNARITAAIQLAYTYYITGALHSPPVPLISHNTLAV